MRTVHRLFVTGAFGGLAAATVAASGAFACTATARVWVSGHGEGVPIPSTITAGTVIDVHIVDFHETGRGTHNGDPADEVSEVTITWLYPEVAGAWTGRELGRMHSPAWVGDQGQEAIVPFEVPGVRPSSEPHYVRAEQKINGVSSRIVVRAVLIPPTATATTTTVPPATTTTLPATTLPPTTLPTTTTTLVPAGQNANPDGTPDTTPGARTNPDRGRSPGREESGSRTTPGPLRIFASPTEPSPPGSDAPSSDQASATGQPIGPTGQPATDRRDGAVAPATPPNDLWSGLEPGSTPSLLDPLPSPTTGSNPLAGLLLAAGVVSFAGVAAAAGRRRLAVRRTSR